MYHIRLSKALSYTGIVHATAQKPDVYIEDEATYDAAMATGFFTLVSAGPQELTVEAAEGTALPPIPEYGGKTLIEMNVSELETFATYKGIILKGISRKADIIKKLKAELPEEELEGIIEYGSPTMVDLEDK